MRLSRKDPGFSGASQLFIFKYSPWYPQSHTPYKLLSVGCTIPVLCFHNGFQKIYIIFWMVHAQISVLKSRQNMQLTVWQKMMDSVS